jgi:hypothetical protein
MEQSYKTTFANDSRHSVIVYEADAPLVVLDPMKREDLEAYSAETVFTAFAAVVFRENGEVELTPREGFVQPEPPTGFVRLVALNIDGRPVEKRDIEGVGLVYLMKGVPVPLVVPEGHKLAKYERWEIVRASHWREATPDWPNYAVLQTSLVDKYTERGAAK